MPLTGPSTAQTAARAVGNASVALGALSFVTPRLTAGTFGVRARTNPALPLLVRMVGIRNLTMGASLLTADDDEDRRHALQLGLLVGAADMVAVVSAVRRGVVSKRAAALQMTVLLGIAAAGLLALED